MDNVWIAVLLLFALAGVFALLVWQNQTEKRRIETNKEISRLLQVIDGTDDLIQNLHFIPDNKKLLLCLKKRNYYTFKDICDLDPKNKGFQSRRDETKYSLNEMELESIETVSDSRIRVPEGDKQAIALLQLIKSLRKIVKAEHGKGLLSTNDYVEESARLEALQIQVNIENVFKRVELAKAGRKYGTAIQLCKKGMDALSTRNDNYSSQAHEKLESILNELKSHQKKKGEEERDAIIEKEEDDLEKLFQPKKKW